MMNFRVNFRQTRVQAAMSLSLHLQPDHREILSSHIASLLPNALKPRPRRVLVRHLQERSVTPVPLLQRRPLLAGLGER